MNTYMFQYYFYYYYYDNASVQMKKEYRELREKKTFDVNIMMMMVIFVWLDEFLLGLCLRICSVNTSSVRLMQQMNYSLVKHIAHQ